MPYQTRKDLQDIIERKDAEIRTLEEMQAHSTDSAQQAFDALFEAQAKLDVLVQENAELKIKVLRLAAKRKQMEKLFKMAFNQFSS